jgi:threonine aldolase
MVVSTAGAIAEARRIRKRLGGGMRQVGVIAAAARVALETGVERLAEDHANARRLAEGLADLDPVAVDIESVETNMVFVDTEAVGLPLLEAIDRLAAHDVGVTQSGGKVRMVTHLDVDDASIGLALDAWRALATDRTEGEEGT